MKIFYYIGLYLTLMYRTFTRPQKSRIFFQNVVKEIEILGINSIPIVVIISVFMGAVITIQTALNLENPLIPRYYIGLATRDSMILEFCSTMVALILSGKVGSNIASEIGSMRISEQIDALDVMGVNSANYLILPKIIASLIFNPVLFVIAVFVGISGGWLVAVSTTIVEPADFIYGILYWFEPFYVTYSLVKTLVFAFIIASVSSFHGYYVSGGARDVGLSGTKAVVHSSVLILMFNLVLTQLMLT